MFVLFRSTRYYNIYDYISSALSKESGHQVVLVGFRDLGRDAQKVQLHRYLLAGWLATWQQGKRQATTLIMRITSWVQSTPVLQLLIRQLEVPSSIRTYVLYTYFYVYLTPYIHHTSGARSQEEYAAGLIWVGNGLNMEAFEREGFIIAVI